MVLERSLERRCDKGIPVVGADDLARPFQGQSGRQGFVADGAQLVAHAQDGSQARFEVEVAGALGFGQGNEGAQVHGWGTGCKGFGKVIVL